MSNPVFGLASSPLAELVFVDVYRDGGSYDARFETVDGQPIALWLQRSRMPDAEGLHHRELFVHDGQQDPDDLQPVAIGSAEEQDVLHRLDEFVVGHGSGCDVGALARLVKMIGYIRRREPVFPTSQLERRPPESWPS
ncbi:MULTISPECIES: hypothetical protein [unclassified Bradyrhizobium]|uniref:hypothetical protein n=1 Tax=unclassified Bradyrhizobium TaxID=2631580 RepID=UPI0029164D50|nr:MULTISPECIES: hypothetical protein [unclassified Bradyrhizobium]